MVEDRSAHVELTHPVYEFEELNETNTDLYNNNATSVCRPLVVIIDANIDAEGLKASFGSHPTNFWWHLFSLNTITDCLIRTLNDHYRSS